MPQALPCLLLGFVAAWRGCAARTVSLRALGAIGEPSAGAAAPAPAAGGAPSAQGPAPAPANGTALQDPCECYAKDQCTCEAQLEYLACVQKKCSSSKCACDIEKDVPQVCEELATSTCSSEIKVGCGPTPNCRGLFHQLHDGMAGLVLNTEHLGDAAYCGPFGKCSGEITVVASIHKAEQGSMLQCKLATSAGADLDNKQEKDVVSCSTAVESEQATCTIPMVKELASGAFIEGKCWLEGKSAGGLLTDNAWFKVSNKYSSEFVEQLRSDRALRADSGAHSGWGGRSWLLAALGAAALAA